MIPSSAPSRVPAPQAASPHPRCNGSSRSSLTQRQGQKGPRHCPHSRPHRQTPIGGRQPHRWRCLLSTNPPPSIATSARAAFAAAVNYLRPALTRRYVRSLADVGKDLSSKCILQRVPMAGRRWSPGRLQRYLLQPLPHLPREGRPPSCRACTSYATPPPSSVATSASRSSP